MANGVKSVMVELNRFGQSEGDILQKGARYIRTTGDEQPACERPLGLSYAEFENAFYALRYTKDVTPEQTAAAIEKLHAEAAQMFDGIDLGQTPGTTQVDVVTSASELWAFPFEAFARDKDDLVITRRIRGGFGEHVDWPTVPKVLFVHAAVSQDKVLAALVEKHKAALTEALVDWAADPQKEGRLKVEEVYSLAALEKVRETADYTHIHFLAHGIEVPSKDLLGRKVWGVRLGVKEGVHPEEVAKALAPRKGLPVTVTLASCDSANQTNSAVAAFSLAQALHRAGVPVVVASQLPLTMHGSEILTREFYKGVLNGEDIRRTLQRVRIALRADTKAEHDWLSLVSYVRLPETYADHLERIALKMDFAILQSAQKRLDAALNPRDDVALARIEKTIRERISVLSERLKGNDLKKADKLECQGLLASAYKRLAELLFERDGYSDEQVALLRTSLDNYRTAFASDLNSHWHGLQQLALQAVLDGAIDSIDYEIVRRAASNDEDFWRFGTLAELQLLSEFAKQTYDADAATSAVQTFLQRCTEKEQPGAVDSSRLQLRRYTRWWVPEKFKTNLAERAGTLVALLTAKEAKK